MRILVVEYVTGGGFIDETLPDGLVYEGQEMLTSLVDDLLDIDNVEISITCDYRLLPETTLAKSARLSVFIVEQGQKLQNILPHLIRYCDAVWPIAPETASALTEICQLAEVAGKILLSSTSEAVAITGDKLMTHTYLSRYNIPVIPTCRFSDMHSFSQQWRVIKPIDGVGCEGVCRLDNEADFQRLANAIDNRQHYILQPFIRGKAMSLSCLFKQGMAWLISCNEQKIEIIAGQFILRECVVNATPDHDRAYQLLIEWIAGAIPQLWGYVGIDLIETAHGPQIVEINPRLTTSYVGLREALRINVAEQVLRLLNAEPILAPTKDSPVRVNVIGEI